MRPAAGYMHRALDRPLARYCVAKRFDPVFRDGPNLHWLRLNWSVYKRFSNLNAERFVHVGMFSFSRAGSHLFESQFHYVPSCFCFAEAHPDFRNGLNWRNFLCQGMYRTDSVQDKSGSELTHLFYNCNKRPRLLDHPMWGDGEERYRRKWICLLRNPLRILLSRQATGKQKWQWSEQMVSDLFNWYEKARKRFIELLEHRPDDVKIVSVEQFAATPDGVLSDVCRCIGLDARLVASRPGPRTFFKTISRTGETPVVRNGRFASPTRDIFIQGWGGEFNPLYEVDAERLYRHDIVAEMPADLLRLARSRLGERAFEFYVGDKEHRFAGVGAEDLLRL